MRDNKKQTRFIAGHVFGAVAACECTSYDCIGVNSGALDNRI